MEKFSKLGLSNDLVNTLKEMGFVEPSEIQEKSIPLALKGRDIVGGSATGSGKTLAFSSAIIEKLNHTGKVEALVLTPTRELAEQVTKSIRRFSVHKKLNILPIYGGTDMDNQIKRIRNSDVIVGTPGRILDHLNKNTLDLNHLKILVLDEMDRMFDMGFQKDVEKIIYNCPEKRQTMLFSATISEEIEYLIKKHTKNPEKISVKSYVDELKLKQIYYDVSNNQKFSLFVHLLKNEHSKQVMVFCNTRRNADFVANNLRRNGINADAIHGGMLQNKRTRILEGFHNKGTHVLVCTDVAARGLDIKGVSHVYNYDLPKTKTDYVHRIGRTARAGTEGIAINLVSNRDYDNFDVILRDKTLEIQNVELPEFPQVRISLNEEKPRRFSNSNNRTNRRLGNSGGRRFPSRDSSRNRRNSSNQRFKR